MANFVGAALVAARVGAVILGIGIIAPSSRRAEPLSDLRDIESPAVAGAGQHNLAVAADGRVYFSWIDPEQDSVRALRFAVLGGGEWSRPRTIAQGKDWFINWADFPSMAATGDVLVAHWLQKSSLGRYSYDVKIARSADGGRSWSAPMTPHRDATPTEHGFATLWPLPDGGFGAVWVDGRKSADPDTTRRAMALRVATILPSGALGAEQEVDTRICDCCQTAAAWTSSGPVVVYRDRTSAEIRDIGIIRQVNGAWTEPRIVSPDDWHINACPVNGPAIAADGRRVAVAWYTGAQDTRRVKVAFSDDAGATFGAPVQVDDGRPVGRVAIIMVDGGALVSWLEDTGTGAEVRVRRIETSGSRGDAMMVARTTAARPSGFPRMVRSGDRVVFAWREPEGGTGPRVRTRIARISR